MKNKGFTLVELIVVIVILGILAVVAAPRVINMTSDAKTASLEAIAGNMKSTADMVRMKALLAGLSVTSGVIPDAEQGPYVINFGFGSAEVETRTLCPEVEAELGDQLTFFDFMEISENDQLTRRLTSAVAAIGYDLPTNITPFQTQGCFAMFHAATCDVIVVSSTC